MQRRTPFQDGKGPLPPAGPRTQCHPRQNPGRRVCGATVTKTVSEGHSRRAHTCQSRDPPHSARSQGRVAAVPAQVQLSRREGQRWAHTDGRDRPPAHTHTHTHTRAKSTQHAQHSLFCQVLGRLDSKMRRNELTLATENVTHNESLNKM